MGICSLVEWFSTKMPTMVVVIQITIWLTDQYSDPHLNIRSKSLLFRSPLYTSPGVTLWPTVTPSPASLVESRNYPFNKTKMVAIKNDFAIRSFLSPQTCVKLLLHNQYNCAISIKNNNSINYVCVRIEIKICKLRKHC